MVIKYHGKQYEAVSELEDGEEELDLFEDGHLEKTMEFSNELLERTMDLKSTIDLVGDMNHE